MDKKTIQIILDKIKKLQRWDLEWEWMTENNNGDFIRIDEVKQLLIDILKEERL
jgi:hypothetical protein